MIKNVIILFLLSLFSYENVEAQTPPARTYYYNNNGVKTDVKERWDENSEGFRNGRYILYAYGYNNKYYVDVVGSYINGKKDGEWKAYSFFADGELLSIGKFKNDLKVGYWKESYSATDKVFQEGAYGEGKRSGKWINCKSEATIVNADDHGNAETILGYNTIYSNGKVTAIINPSGVNILETYKHEQLNKVIDEDYNKCASIADYQNFRKKYPSSKWDNDALNKIKILEAREKFIALPTIENLKNYEIVINAIEKDIVVEHSSVLFNLNNVLTFNKEVGSNGFQFTLPNQGTSAFDSGVSELYTSVLRPYHLTDILSYLERDDKNVTIYTTPKMKMIKLVSSRWTIRYFIGDQFTTLSNDVHNTYSVLKDGKEICSCNLDEIYLIQDATQPRKIKQFGTDYSKFCALRVVQIKGIKNSLENFLGYMNTFNQIEDKDYKTFLIERQITLKNSREPNHTDYLFLSYLYWMNGNENLALETFKKTKEVSGAFLFESEKLGKSISFGSVDEFNKYVFSYFIAEFSYEIVFPNEKEMLKLIKKQ